MKESGFFYLITVQTGRGQISLWSRMNQVIHESENKSLKLFKWSRECSHIKGGSFLGSDYFVYGLTFSYEDVLKDSSLSSFFSPLLLCLCVAAVRTYVVGGTKNLRERGGILIV